MPERRMIHLRAVLLAAAVVVTSVCLTTHTEAQDTDQQTLNKVAAALKPSLVRIHVVSVDHRQGREVKQESFGSGVIISEDGHVITNHHVAGRAKQLTCTMADKTEIEADLVGSDALSDIAVIKLKPEQSTTFPVAKFGDSSKVKVGDRVLAMGSPLAFSQSVTVGVVSNTELVMSESEGWGKLTLDGEDVGSIVRWIAHDADIFGGNSGGPLVNTEGEIVGINEIRIGLGGAIPGNLAKDASEQIIKNGKVTRSWLGVGVQPLLKSLQDRDGVLISSIITGSPAEDAGFQPGDVLIKIAGQDCSARFAEELPLFNQFVFNLPIGKEAEATVLRDGKEVAIKVTPTERGEAEAIPREFKEWGICASDITLFTAKEMKREDTSGILVVSVRPGGPVGTAKPDISEYDIITEVGGKKVNNLEDFHRVTTEITKDQDEPVPSIVCFERDADKYLTVVKVGIQDIEDPGLEVRKAWLPASTQVLTRDIAEALGMKDRTGVRVTQVYPNSTAERAGLRVGDLLVELDGTPIAASQPEDREVLPAMIRQYKIGTPAEFTVVRDGKEEKISIELASSPKLVREMKKYRDDNFDFTVRDIAFQDRIAEQWAEDQTGVIAEGVGEGGWASLAGLSGGDLIVSVDGLPASDVAAFEKLMQEIATNKPKSTIIQLKSGIHYRFIELRPTWPSD